jgi:hypothetical protein
MMWSWGKTEPERFPGMPLCFVDREANKYTTAVAASDGDWWLGARILMLRDFERMRKEGTNVVLMDIRMPGPDVKPWATATSTSVSHAVMSSAQSRGCRQRRIRGDDGGSPRFRNGPWHRRDAGACRTARAASPSPAVPRSGLPA